MPYQPIACTPKRLPTELQIQAAAAAREVNPANHPPLAQLALARPDFAPTHLDIAVVTSKYWGADGVRLTVGFLDDPSTELRAKILSHMNAWSQTANVSFVETRTDPQVRIARARVGHWSYLGTDITLIDADQPTMNLQEFTMQTPDSEFFRVVRHETGHTLGCPHEHMRKALVELLDVDKTIAYFGEHQHWSPEKVRAQVLTPLEEGTLMGTDHPDMKSIMCYQIPGEITRDGRPILGGTDIDPSDSAFMAKMYPKPRTTAVAATDAGPEDGHAHDRLGPGEAGEDAIMVELPSGARVHVHAGASAAQVRGVLEALDAHARG